MPQQREEEVTIYACDPEELFRERPFDPFTDEPHTVSSIAQMAQLPHLARRLKHLRLRIVMPEQSVARYGEAAIRAALRRYCAHMTINAKRKLAALRWVGMRTFFIGLVFFGMSLAASGAVQRLSFLPDAVRTLVSEAIVVAGWVLLWQPLDTLVQGWWPHWDEERTFKALAEMHVRVEAAAARGA